MSFDGVEFGREIVQVVSGYVERSTQPLLARIATLEARLAEVEEQRALRAEQPKDGADGADGADGVGVKDAHVDEGGNLVLRLTDGHVIDAGYVRGKDGADGIGLAGSIIDRDGNLIVTMTDGSTKELGQVLGEKGQPGRDGIGFDDLQVDHDGDRTISLRFARGDHVKSFDVILPAMIYRGVWSAGKAYSQGDMVTWGGSLWHCDSDTVTEKPDSPEKGWTLAAKRGSNGKDLRNA